MSHIPGMSPMAYNIVEQGMDATGVVGREELSKLLDGYTFRAADMNPRLAGDLIVYQLKETANAVRFLKGLNAAFTSNQATLSADDKVALKELDANVRGNILDKSMLPPDLPADAPAGALGLRPLASASSVPMMSHTSAYGPRTQPLNLGDTDIRNYGGITHYTDAHGSTFTWTRDEARPKQLQHIVATIQAGSIGQIPTDPTKLRLRLPEGGGYSRGHGVAACLGGVNHPVNGFLQIRVINQALGAIENAIKTIATSKPGVTPLTIDIKFGNYKDGVPENVQISVTDSKGTPLIDDALLTAIGTHDKLFGKPNPLKGYTAANKYEFSLYADRGVLCLENR